MSDINKQILIEITGKTESLKKDAVELSIALDNIKTSQKELEKQGKKNTTEYVNNAAKVRALSASLRETNRELDHTLKASKSANGSLTQNRAIVGSLTAEYNRLGAELGETSDEAVAMAAKIKGLTDKIKEQEKATGNHRSEVGNYGLAMQKATGIASSFGGTLGQAAQGLNMLAGGLGTATKGQSMLNMAMQASPIGLLLGLIATMISYLRKMEPVMDKIDELFAGFSGAVTEAGRMVYDFVAGITSMGDLFGKLGNFIAHPIDSFKKLGTNIGNAAKEAASLERALDNLKDQGDSLDNFVANANAEANILRLKARNRTIDAASRKKYLQEAEELERKANERVTIHYNNSLNLAVRQAQQLKKLTAQDIADLKKGNLDRAIVLLNEGKITKEAYDNLKDVYQKGIEEKGRQAQRLERIIVQQENAEQKAEEKREKNAAAHQKKLEQIAAINEKNHEAKLKLIESNLAKEVELIEGAQEKAERAEQIRYAKAIADYNAMKGQTKEIDEIVNRAIELEQKIHQKNLLKITQDGNIERANVQRAADNKRLEKSRNLSKTLEESDKQLAEIRAEHAKTAEEKRVADQAELEKSMKINAINHAKSLNEAIAGAKSDQIKRGLARDLDSIKRQADTENQVLQNKLDKGLINQKEFEDAKAALDAKVDAKNTERQKKAFEAEKKLKIKMTLINGALAVINAFATLVYPANIAAAIAVAGETAIQVGVINNQKFAKGGQYKSDGKGALLPGYSKKDNINSMLREGEAVVVSEAMKDPWARNLVSAVNVAYGGRDFSTKSSGKKYAYGGVHSDGGFSGRYYEQSSGGQDALVRSLTASIMQNLPDIVVDVKDVYKEVGNLVQVQNRVTL